MERQVGVHQARVRVRKGSGWVFIEFAEERPIAFAELGRLCDRKGLTPRGMRLTAVGELELADCATCASQRPFLLMKNGQRIEVEGNLGVDGSGLVRGRLQDWETEHPILFPEKR